MRPIHPQLPALHAGAALSLLRILCVLAATVTGIIALTSSDKLLLPALILVTLSVLLVVAGFVISASVKCTHCHSPLFAPHSCEKHPRAESFLGSHLIEMSLDILLGTSFRCMYCGERCGCRHTSSTSRRRQSGPSTAKRRVRSLSPSSRTVTSVLHRDPSAAARAPRCAPQAPRVSLTRTPAPSSSPEVPRAPYSTPRCESTSPFDSYLTPAQPSPAPQHTHFCNDPSPVA